MVKDVPYCRKCGKESSHINGYCPNCGAYLDLTKQKETDETGIKAPKKTDVLGLMSLGVLLIILSLSYMRYRVAPSIIIGYLQNIAEQGMFIKPPIVVLEIVIFFFNATGIWSIILSGLRVVFLRSVGKALSDLSGGFFLLFSAFLLGNYSRAIFSGQITVGYFLAGLGVLIIVNSVVKLVVPENY